MFSQKIVWGELLETGRGYGCTDQGDEAFGLAAGFAEAGEVGLHGRIRLEGGQSRFKDCRRAGVLRGHDAVVHPFSFAAGGDYSSFTQVGEVAGDLGLAFVQDLDEIADADLAAIHKVEQSQAGGVGEGGEDLNEIDGLQGASHTPIYMF